MIGPVIDGAVIRLRPLEEADATESYLAWLNDAEVTRYLESRFAPPASVEDVAAYVRSVRADPASYPFAIARVADGHHVGNVKLGPIDRHHGVSDIGIMLGDRSSWGRGYATEALSLLVEWAFAELGLRKLTAGAYASNRGSVRTFERAGFHIEGMRKLHYLSGDDVVDGILMARFAPPAS